MPEIDRSCALFLDLDGTLVEIADTPDQVAVPTDLPPLLARLKELLGGALAIISGRPMTDTDRLLAPFVTSGAGEHGAAIRFADGTVENRQADVVLPHEWRRQLEQGTAGWPGVSLEAKPHGLTIHYRLAADREDDVWKLARQIVPENDPQFCLMRARMAVEIALKGTTKGHAVEALMARQPFRSRVPLFIGDDFTDEAGMIAARRLGGQGLRVDTTFGGKPAAVRAWLRQSADRLERPVAS